MVISLFFQVLKSRHAPLGHSSWLKILNLLVILVIHTLRESFSPVILTGRILSNFKVAHALTFALLIKQIVLATQLWDTIICRSVTSRLLLDAT
jgi:hypothetical protein